MQSHVFHVITIHHRKAFDEAKGARKETKIPLLHNSAKIGGWGNKRGFLMLGDRTEKLYPEIFPN